MLSFFLQGFTSDPAMSMTICNAWPFFIKEVYRQNMGVPKADCVVPEDDDMNAAFCPLYCIDEDAVTA